MLNNRHAAPEAPARLGEFEADISAAEDNKVLRQTIELEYLDVRERRALCQAGNGRNCRVGAQVEKNPVPLLTCFCRRRSGDFERFRPHEASQAHN